MREKIELTIQEVDEALKVLEEIPIKYIGVAQYISNYFRAKFKEDTSNDNSNSTLSSQGDSGSDSSVSGG